MMSETDPFGGPPTPSASDLPGVEHLPHVVSIVGPSGVGKTTLVEGVIGELRKRGLVVGTVKHAPHGFEADRPGSDSWRHRDAGADRVLLAGAERSVLFIDGGAGAGPAAREASPGHHTPTSDRSEPAAAIPGDRITHWITEHLAACDVVLVEGFSAVSELVVAVTRSDVPPKLVDADRSPTLTVTDRPDDTGRQIGFDELDTLVDRILLLASVDDE